MDYRAFLSSLDRNDRLSLTKRSDAPALVHLVGHLALITCCGLYLAYSLPLWPIATVWLGVSLIFLFTLEHECSHKTAFKTQWLNESIGRIAGLVVLVPFEWFRLFHHEHHRHTQDPLRDPELESGKPQTMPALIWHLSGFPMWRSLIGQLWRDMRGVPGATYVPESAVRRVQSEALVSVGIYAVAFGNLVFSDLVFWYWILPIIVGQPFLRFYLLAEHGACPIGAGHVCQQ